MLVAKSSKVFMAGKGFTVKKDWDNPIEHAMPDEARVPAEVRLGSVVVAPATVLAPMAGVTDTVFRRFIRHASLFTAAANANARLPCFPRSQQRDLGHPLRRALRPTLAARTKTRRGWGTRTLTPQ